MTRELIAPGAKTGKRSSWRGGPSVQTPEQMFERLDERVHSLNAIAARLYGAGSKD